MSRTKMARTQGGWDAAIEDAREDIKKLETAISVFEENKLKGEPWPGAQSNGQSSEPCHSV